uniref:Uncharacterized protein n=1 Tax=Zea mays TaxID=4577 RepID=C4J2C9_MAIZE|nr:unknown [Zea mays]
MMAPALLLPPVAVDEVDDDVPPAPSEAEAAADDELDLDDLVRLLRRHPPPTGTFRSAPPRVQYRRHVLQKWRGWESE